MEQQVTASSVPDWLSWINRDLLALMAGSLAVTVLAGLLQISFGVYQAANLSGAWAGVSAPALRSHPLLILEFLLGESTLQFFGLTPPNVELSNRTLVIWSIRMPRVIVAAIVGANLAISGAIFQAVTRNELASPYVLGVSSGAGFAVVLVLVFYSALTPLVPLVAAVGGGAAFLLVYLIAWQGGTNPVRLVLAGVIVAMVGHSLQTGAFFFVDDVGAARQAIAWTTGDLTGVEWQAVRTALPWSVPTLAVALVSARQLNVLLLGDHTAGALGMNVERVRFGLAAVAVVAAALAIAVAGLVGFVGLVVPHIVRSLVGSDYKRVLVGCLFAGPALMVLADVAARLTLWAFGLGLTQIPAGIVTGLLGGPYFLYIMRRRDVVGEF